MRETAKKTAVWRRIEDKIFIIDPEREKMHSLNETAAFFWELLAAGKTPDEIVRRAAERFEASEKEITGDLEEFTRLLKKEKLIV